MVSSIFVRKQLTCDKNSQPLEVLARHLSVRNIGPRRCKWCDGKSISYLSDTNKVQQGQAVCPRKFLNSTVIYYSVFISYF